MENYFKNDDDKLIFEIVAESLILELDKVLKLNSNSKSDAKVFVKKKLAMTIFLNEQTDPITRASTEKDIVSWCIKVYYLKNLITVNNLKEGPKQLD